MARVDKRNLKIPQGSAYRVTFTCADESGNAIDLSGFTARCKIRTSFDAATPMFDATTENGLLSIEHAAGKVTLNVPADDSAAWTDYEAVYDVEVVSPGGEPTRIVKGRVSVDREVTY